MTVQEYILAELTAEPITKIVGEPGQGDINKLESELAKQAAKIKTAKDIIEKGHKHEFLILVLWQSKYGNVIGNQMPKDPRGYDDTI